MIKFTLSGCGDPDCLRCGKGRQEKGSDESSRKLKSFVSGMADALLASSSLGNPTTPFGPRQMSLQEMSEAFDTIVRGDAAGPLPSGPAAAAASIPAKERALKAKVEPYLLKTEHAVGWDDVVGNDAARTALVEAIEAPKRHRALYDHYGLRPPKGVLLYGPPGCGKTMLGKAAAAAVARLYGDREAALLKINGPEIQTPFLGMTEGIIRDVFAYARAVAARTKRPLVVFIDEADAILPARDAVGGGRRAMPWEESQVATFLTEMDGLESSGAFVILATNRPERIDAALLRDGRCDRKIKVVRPDRAAADILLRKAFDGLPGVGADPGAFAAQAIEALFDPERRLARLAHDGGADFLTLGDIVSGALLVGLVERVKTQAFRRDLAAGTKTGIVAADIDAAVAELDAENAGLDHYGAASDFAETHGLVLSRVDPIRRAA